MFRRNHHHQGEYYMSSLKLQLYWLVLTILSTITLVSSNIALPDDGGYTETCWSCFNTLRTGDADLRFLHYNYARRMKQICVFNTRLFSLHSTLNYAIHRACLRMVLLTDVYRNLTSL